jgi:hypothetical protein
VAGSALYWLYTKRYEPPAAVVKPKRPQIAPDIAQTTAPAFIPVMPVETLKESEFFGSFLKKTSIKVVESVEAPPHEDPDFGTDRERNRDQIGVDDYMALPLEGTGLTHVNRVRFVDLDAPPPEGAPRPFRFVFFRLKILKTRSPAAATAAIGGFTLLNGADVVHHPRAKVWNPHTGERTTYYPEAAWSDSDQKELIVRFPSAVAINGYKIRTSEQDTAFDPVQWRLEGSQNGVYWLPLDERSLAPPFTRGVWATFGVSV